LISSRPSASPSLANRPLDACVCASLNNASTILVPSWLTRRCNPLPVDFVLEFDAGEMLCILRLFGMQGEASKDSHETLVVIIRIRFWFPTSAKKTSAAKPRKSRSGFSQRHFPGGATANRQEPSLLIEHKCFIMPPVSIMSGDSYDATGKPTGNKENIGPFAAIFPAGHHWYDG
jgi:hypothetical protein